MADCMEGREGVGGGERRGLIGQRLNRCAVEGDLEKGMLLNSSRRDAGLPREGLLLGCWFDGWMDGWIHLSARPVLALAHQT
jgi:hypothetical protein